MKQRNRHRPVNTASEDIADTGHIATRNEAASPATLKRARDEAVHSGSTDDTVAYNQSAGADDARWLRDEEEPLATDSEHLGSYEPGIAYGTKPRQESTLSAE